MEFPTQGPAVAWDVLDIGTLVTYLRSSDRTRPVVVLTVAPEHSAPYVSAEEIDRAAHGRVDVVTIPTDDLTRSFSGQLSDTAAGVFRGACRVYPPGSDWERNPHRHRLLMARDAGEITRLPAALIADLTRVLSSSPAPRPDVPPWVGATTSSVVRPKPTPRPSAGRTPARPNDIRAVKPAPSVPAEIASEADAEALAAYLSSGARTLPVAVVTRATGTSEAYVDVPQLRKDLAGLAVVCEITTLAASWAFSAAVPDLCQVYGGASRVYPLGIDWRADPYLSPLRFAYGRTDRMSVTRRLIADAMGMATTGFHTVEAGAVARTSVQGRVEGVVGEQALVTIPGQFPGVIWPEQVEPGVLADRLFVKGMPVKGELDPETRRIDVHGMRRSADEALAAYRPGDTVMARVSEVGADACRVELFPGVILPIPASDVLEDAGDLRSLMRAGDVLPVWYGGHDEATREWLLSLREAAEPVEAVDAPSILRGGPPWLVPRAPAPPEPDVRQPAAALAEPRSAEMLDVEPSAELVQGLRREIQQLTRLLEQSESQAATLRSQLADTRSRLRSALRKAGRRGGAEVDDTQLFLDGREQLDFEIYVAWARTTQPSEKRDRPLKKWTYGPEFFDSLRQVEGVGRTKVVEVIVHVLTGRDAELASRELHQLRSGKGGDDPRVVRAGGETCWRVSLQTKTPSARRLHYWMCADGSIELSSIRVHDDFRP